MKPDYCRDHVVVVFDGVDAVEFRLHRFNAAFVYRRGIHAGRVSVACSEDFCNTAKRAQSALVWTASAAINYGGGWRMG